MATIIKDIRARVLDVEALENTRDVEALETKCKGELGADYYKFLAQLEILQFFCY